MGCEIVRKIGRNKMVYKVLRRPKTTQERRASDRGEFIHEDGYAVKVRAKRNFRNLPEHRDDIVRKDIKDRSWKGLRKDKWKS